MWFNKTIPPIEEMKIVKHHKGSKHQRILDLLKAEKKVTNSQLNKICFRYSSLICEMRKEGYRISTVRVNNDGLYLYVYRGRRA